VRERCAKRTLLLLILGGLPMAVETTKILELIQQEVLQGTFLDAAWPKVIDALAPDLSDADRNGFKALNIMEDRQRILEWVRQWVAGLPSRKAVRGIWFGIEHPDRNGEMGCDFFAEGYSQFELDGGAWLSDPVVRSTSGPNSEVLYALMQIGHRELAETCDIEDVRQSVIELPRWYGMLVIADLCRTEVDLIRGRAVRRGVAVGFSSGDVIALGEASRAGFQPVGSPAASKRKRKRTLLPGDYFSPEGGPNSILCECTSPKMSRDEFRRLTSPVVFEATINTQFGSPKGSVGSLTPPRAWIMVEAVGKALVNDFPGDIRLHELRIDGRDDPFCVLQVLNCLPCYDSKTSDLKGRRTLIQEETKNHNLFFAKGYYEWGHRFVTRRAAERMIELGLSEIVFVPTASVSSLESSS
jgi:hypothetical protein